ncbi:MAG TPA: hypothetical protein VFY21_02910 [Xanthobacteraceae bacterium]|nr:hypothetical protein [Xanthobacteraceae bacterium]
MRDLFRSSALALILAAGVAGISVAQDTKQPDASAQQPAQKQAPALSKDGETSPGARDAAKSILENTPGIKGPDSGGAAAQDAEQKKDAASGGKTDKPVDNAQGGQGHPAPLQTIGPPNAGPLPVRGAGLEVPGATRQTAPAKFSEENAQLAEYSIMGYPVQLNDQQKQAIWQSLGVDSTKETASAEGKTIHAEVGVFLPDGVEAQALPDQLSSQMPELRGLKYVKADDKVLLVAPSNGIVRGVIGE